jgi:hypothetical protein
MKLRVKRILFQKILLLQPSIEAGPVIQRLLEEFLKVGPVVQRIE